MRQGRESRGRAVREMMVAWKCVEMVEMFWKCRGDRSCNTDLNCELRAHDSSAGAGAPLCPRLFFCIPLIEAMAVKCCGVVNMAHACTDDGGGSRFRRSSRALLPLRIMDDRGMCGDSRGVGFALR